MKSAKSGPNLDRLRDLPRQSYIFGYTSHDTVGLRCYPDRSDSGAMGVDNGGMKK